MFSLAASLALSWITFAPARFVDVYPQAALSNTEQQVWRELQPSILIVSQNGSSRGSAVCIDASGLYLAHQNSIHVGDVDGVTLTGKTYTMRFVANDRPTGLVLLQVVGADIPQCPVVKVADNEHARQGTLLAVLGTGPIRADIGQPNIVATYEKTNQSVMLNEIRFAAPMQLLTGALLFDDRGQLVGVLGATLAKQSQVPTVAKVTASQAAADRGTGIPVSQAQGAGQGGGGGQGGGQFGNSGGLSNLGASQKKYGPADQNVAYAVSPLLLTRVINGFLSPTHDVRHPALGVVCKDTFDDGVPNGVAIQRVTTGSGAANAGLKVGDIILNIDGTEIRNVVDFARVMLTKEVNQKITIAIRRKDQTLPFDALVGRVTNPEQLQQELNQILR